jgi:hypothetical protein
LANNIAIIDALSAEQIIQTTQTANVHIIHHFAHPLYASGAYSGTTVGTTAAVVLAANTAHAYLDIVNQSSTATIACNFGGTAVINGPGSITIPPGWHRSWEGFFVPTDAVSCVASAANTPITIGAF